MEVIILVRIIVPITILMYPFAGSLLSVYLDGLDWEYLRLVVAFNPILYQYTDKFLDLYYQVFEVTLTQRWTNIPAKRMANFLFCFRLCGVLIFFLTGLQEILIIFPNTYEMFFIIYEGLWFFRRKEPKFSLISLTYLLTILVIPKVIQEYFLHHIN